MMHYPTLLTLVLSALLGASQAADFVVNVGQNGFTYSPDHVSGAVVGDTVTFHFFPSRHSVVQGTFATPCAPASGGFNSGFRGGSTTTSADNTFQITVNNTQPIWIYCAQTGHCPQGMVFAVNPANDTQLAQYRQNAVGGASTASGGSSGTSSGAASPTNSNCNNNGYGGSCGAAFSTAQVVPAFLITLLVGSVGALVM